MIKTGEYRNYGQMNDQARKETTVEEYAGKEESLLKLIRHRQLRDQLFILQKIKFLQSKGAISYVLV